MAAPFLSWSWSRYSAFTTCPRQLWHQVAPKGHVDRVEFEPTKQILDGREIDEALSARLGKKVPLPAKFQPYEPMCQLIDAAPGSKHVQMQLALDQTLKPCGYRDWDRAYVRVIYDLSIIDRTHAFLWDFKNGKISTSEGQNCLFSATAFHVLPEVETIDTAYIWLQYGVVSPKTYRRRELPDMWQEFIPTVERMQVAHKNGYWPAEPQKFGKSFACRWCGANKAGKCKDAKEAYNP